MTREELVGYLLVTVILVLLLLIMKFLGFIGRKVGLWKPYFRMKGQRYGNFNTKETRNGKRSPVVAGEALKGGLLLLGAFVILSILPDIKVMRIVLNIIAAATGIYAFYIIGQFFNCTCIYCSTGREEMEQFIEKVSQKKQFFKAQITEIQYEDGWYMIFYKEPEERKKALLAHPNFYVRECPKRLKRLNSMGWMLLYLLPGFLVSAAIYYFGLKFFGIHKDILTVAMAIPPMPIVYRIIKEKTELFRECKAQFQEEENLPEDKYKVEGHYSSDGDGRLIFTVKPIEESEGN